jgi:hypothetical protein
MGAQPIVVVFFMHSFIVHKNGMDFFVNDFDGR